MPASVRIVLVSGTKDEFVLRLAQAADAGFGEPGLRSLAELVEAKSLGKLKHGSLAELDDAAFLGKHRRSTLAELVEASISRQPQGNFFFAAIHQAGNDFVCAIDPAPQLRRHFLIEPLIEQFEQRAVFERGRTDIE